MCVLEHQNILAPCCIPVPWALYLYCLCEAGICLSSQALRTLSSVSASAIQDFPLDYSKRVITILPLSMFWICTCSCIWSCKHLLSKTSSFDFLHFTACLFFTCMYLPFKASSCGFSTIACSGTIIYYICIWKQIPISLITLNHITMCYFSGGMMCGCSTQFYTWCAHWVDDVQKKVLSWQCALKQLKHLLKVTIINFGKSTRLGWLISS